MLLQENKRSGLKDELLKTLLDDLKKRIAKKQRPPAHWSKAVPSGSSYDTKVWKILKPFLHSPTERAFDYQKVQSERSDMGEAA